MPSDPQKYLDQDTNPKLVTQAKELWATLECNDKTCFDYYHNINCPLNFINFAIFFHLYLKEKENITNGTTSS